MLRQGHVQFRREVGQQQFLFRVVVDDRQRDLGLVAAGGADGDVRRTAEQAFLVHGIHADVKNLLNICDHLSAAARAGSSSLSHIRNTFFCQIRIRRTRTAILNYTIVRDQELDVRD